MKQMPFSLPRHGPLVAPILLLLFGLYVWQAGMGWASQDSEGSRNQSIRNTSGMIAWRQPQLLDFTGTGIAMGSSAVLRYNGYDPIAVLQVSNLPVLPPGHAYQMWCYDTIGGIDAATVFQVPVDSEETRLVMISAPRLFNAYNHFTITVEPISGSQQPTGETVMRD